jgi:ribosomal protein S18 acetylase RimI-like enzyme
MLAEQRILNVLGAGFREAVIEMKRGGMKTEPAFARLLHLERNPGMSQVCVEADGTIAGTVMCGHDGRRGYMYHVAVSGACRGKGAGREMVSRSLNALREAGIAKCHLMVIEGNALGRSFWSGTGWQERDGIVLFSQNT